LCNDETFIRECRENNTNTPTTSTTTPATFTTTKTTTPTTSTTTTTTTPATSTTPPTTSSKPTKSCECASKLNAILVLLTLITLIIAMVGGHYLWASTVVGQYCRAACCIREDTDTNGEQQELQALS